MSDIEFLTLQVNFLTEQIRTLRDKIREVTLRDENAQLQFRKREERIQAAEVKLQKVIQKTGYNPDNDKTPIPKIIGEKKTLDSKDKLKKSTLPWKQNY